MISFALTEFKHTQVYKPNRWPLRPSNQILTYLWRS